MGERGQKRQGERSADVLVVGGGASGMMAAIAAAHTPGIRVILLERNEKLGKKLYLTGKGRCNLTNGCEGEVFFSNVLTNSKFLYSAYRAFDNRAVMELVERAGCPLKVERGERVFPVSDHSSDVIRALRAELDQRGVQVVLQSRVCRLLTQGPLPGEEGPRAAGVALEDGGTWKSPQVILATGGLSYPSTGSTGDGYRFAQACGHQVTPRTPALVPLTVREGWCRELMGLSLKNVSLTLKKGSRELYSGFGEMLFTHFGVSGPLVLTASSYYGAGGGGQMGLELDLKPALTGEQLDKRLQREFAQAGSRQFSNSLGGLFPHRLIPVMVRLSGIEPDKRAGEITRTERQAFGEMIKSLPLTVTGTRGYEEAVVTRGGVEVRQVSPSTMESKLVRGLYFAGEMLDLDALTGGYNLQIAWSTGYLAGRSAARRAAEGASARKTENKRGTGRI